VGIGLFGRSNIVDKQFQLDLHYEFILFRPSDGPGVGHNADRN